MSETLKKSGRCLCGAVTVTASNIKKNTGACHCQMCRKWCGGGPLLAVQCGGDVLFGGEEHIAVFDSSAWAERGFCKKCGSPLFYRIKEKKMYVIPAGVFDDDEGLSLDHQIFIDEKPALYDFANDTKNMTGAEVFAAYQNATK